nr:thiolase family protein [Candidatus Sigynarchaeum springense]
MVGKTDLSDVVIVDYCRTGIGYKDGSLSSIRSDTMVVELIKALRDRNPKFKNNLENLAKDFKVDSIWGCNSQIGTSALTLGRTAALAAHYPIEIPGMSLNRQCASGMTAISLGLAEIKCGYFDFVVCGGMEQQSAAPIGQDMIWVDRDGNVIRSAPHPSVAVNPYIRDPFDPSKQGIMAGQIPGAEMIGKKYNAPRELLDKFSLWSHEKAWKYAEQRHKENITIKVPYLGNIEGEPNKSVEVRPGLRSSVKEQKCKLLLADNDYPAWDVWKDKLGLQGKLSDNVKYFDYNIDEGMRSKTTMEMMAKMPGIQRKWLLTAGNSCPESDGASGMLLARREAALQLGLKPRARIKALTIVGSDPVLMLTGPQVATKEILKRTGLKMDDFSIIEVNEAFSTVVYAFCKEVGIDYMDPRINPWGGAIAIGHPTGSTGCRLLGTLMCQFEAMGGAGKGKLGLGTLCVGLGMGIAGIVELE